LEVDTNVSQVNEASIVRAETPYTVFAFVRKLDGRDTLHQNSNFSGPIRDAKGQLRKDSEAWLLVKVTITL
jgi:hypothetical protein